MTTRKTNKIKVGQTVVTNWFTHAYPVGLCSEAMVTVVEKARGERYRVEASSGALYWLSRDAFHAIGEAW